MDNVKIIEITDSFNGIITEYAIIQHLDGSFTSMLKSTYDEQQAANEATAE